jgi:hypothetical protein
MLISGVSLFSGCRRHSHSHKAEFMVDYISETLDLNDTQQAQLNQIKDDVMTKARQMRADKESMREEFVAQLRCSGYGLRVAGCELRVSGWELRDLRLWISDFGFWIDSALCLK